MSDSVVSFVKEQAMSDKHDSDRTKAKERALDRRKLLLGGTTFAAASAIGSGNAIQVARAQQPTAPTAGRRPNILVIMGDDIGQTNVSAYSFGVMGYRTPNIDRIAREGMMFTDYYAEQSCTAGRSSFITGQATLRTGLSKVGLPGADLGLRAEDITIAEALKPLGYATGQFGKNHLGDKNEFLPTVHGFDEFFGNLYHFNAEEEPEHPDYPKNPAFQGALRSARRAQVPGHRPRRPDRRSALRAHRPADHRGHRRADQEAHGDDRRRDVGRRHRLH
jgi:arylsulfatase A-like enzyme